MTTAAAPLRILLSQEAIAKLGGEIRAVAGARDCILVTPGQAEAGLVELAFVTRDVTGLSTKHHVLPATQAFHDALRARGVTVTTSSGANAPVVAQTALLGLLALARHWPPLLAAQREQRWAPLIASGLPRDLQGQTAVLLGWGPVAREIGRLLQAMGLRLVVVRRSAHAAGPGIRTVTRDDLHDVLPGADWLLLACPLTAETRGSIGAAELALLPHHAGVVNVSRGEVIDEPALIDALRARRIAGAYLDVFATEPLPADSPLWDLPNVIVTPHSAGFSDGNEQRVARMFLDNLGRWLGGEALVNVAGAG